MPDFIFTHGARLATLPVSCCTYIVNCWTFFGVLWLFGVLQIPVANWAGLVAGQFLFLSPEPPGKLSS